MQSDQLNDLNAFVTVANEGSFTRAATKLGASQSAVSHTIRRLEDRLGVQLLIRTTRSLSPTEAGERLLVCLRPALAEIATGIAALGELRDQPAGTIRITTSELAARSILWPAVSRLMFDYPDIRVELSIDGGLTDIVADQFDAGVRLGEAISRDMVAVRIGPDLRMVAVASPAYLARRGTPIVPQDLAEHNCINVRFQTRGNLYAWEFEKDGRALNVRVDGQFVVNNAALMLDAALQGLGVIFVMEDLVKPDLASGKLVRLLDDWSPSFPGYHLYYPSQRQPSPAFALLVEALRH